MILTARDLCRLESRIQSHLLSSPFRKAPGNVPFSRFRISLYTMKGGLDPGTELGSLGREIGIHEEDARFGSDMAIEPFRVKLDAFIQVGRLISQGYCSYMM